jgi:NADH-quinone oxidoreductase subunit G
VVVITIDGRQHEVEDSGRNLLEVCLALGYDLPYFCWHPAMHSVGACRQCAVKQFRDVNDTQGRIVMSCMTVVSDGMIVSIADPQAAAFRKSVAEWLMVNHPHDCPVCDEGGECHLQDMTIMTGHVYRRCRFPKRTFRNQDLGPFLHHEMNRCIHCYRCVRFYRDYAGGRDFGAFGWHDHVYFGRQEDGTLESSFAGNLIEVCPTGVFTDKTLKQHYTRKWDLQTAPSVCLHCGLGCNTLPGERYGTIRRVSARYNYDVNGYFLCDRGRFGYDFTNSERRSRNPRLRRPASDQSEEISPEQALEVVGTLLREHEQVIGIGSPRASVEANLALRQLVGEGSFYQGVSESHSAILAEMIRILREGPVPTASLAQIGKCDAALVLGEDVSNAAPMLDLALRQTVLQQPIKKAKALHLHSFTDAAIREAIQVERGPLYIAHAVETRLDALATEVYRAAPDDIARLGFAVAHALDAEAPAVEGLAEDVANLAAEIAEQLRHAESPVILTGYACGQVPVLQAAANIAWALNKLGVNVRLCFTVPQGNSLGLALLGGPSLDDALERVEQTEDLVAIVLEANLHREMHAGEAERLLRAAEHVVALDFLDNETTRHADVALPVTSFTESSGTFVNNEGRAQRYFAVFKPEGELRESWCWLADLAEARDGQRPWQGLDDLIRTADQLPGMTGLAEAAPLSDFRLAGEKIPRQSERYSGRTAMFADRTMHEPAPPADTDTALSHSMEGAGGQPPPALIPRAWAPGWNSAQAVNRSQERIAGPLKGGPSGKRLLEPTATEPEYYTEVPEPFAADDDTLIVPTYAVFGSDDLSMHSPGVAARAPQPCLAVSTSAWERLGATEGARVRLAVGEATLELALELHPELPEGVAALTVGLPGMPGLCLPAWGEMTLLAAEGGEQP